MCCLQNEVIVSKKDGSILEMPIPLLLENVSNLEADLELLTKARIEMSDIDMFHPCYDLSTEELRF